MPKVDVVVGAEVFLGLEAPEDCTVGLWKQGLGDGTLLGEKILYASKLSCREEEKGRHIPDGESLPEPPGRVHVEGPASVLKMLQLALRKKKSPVSAAPRPPPPRPSLVPTSRPVASPQKALPTPTSLRSDGASARLRFFRAGQQGMRPHMEDRTLGVLQLPGQENASLFGVFDGHGGHEVAEMAVAALPAILASALDSMGPRDALMHAFAQLDRDLFEAQRPPHAFDRVGSTASVCLLIQEAGQLRLICANCGDSRAVLCRQRRAMDLSEDQKPQNPEERARIEAAGGKVELYGPCWRIDAGLNLSRALGDFAYKAHPHKSPNEQMVIAVPELKETVVGKEDEFVVMGSDGVYDVLTSEALVQHLRRSRQEGASWPEAIDGALTKSLSGGDNVSITLVEFIHE